jgi:VIT1/CCC1 family predicted Fe2+/Mn2+ transporter
MSRRGRARRGVGEHPEAHRSGRGGWLRAAVLGSDDAIVSTASLLIGVASSEASTRATLTAGAAGLVAGAMSMAVGEYVSVSSQRDAERSDIEGERLELATEPAAELDELTGIYVARGLEPVLARRVATALSAHDRLGAHLRDELHLDGSTLSRPLQAAWISAASFASFALIPLGAFFVAPAALRIWAVVAVSLASLGALGALGGRLGGAPPVRAALRVTLGGGLAMMVTAAIGHFLGVAAR